MRKSLFISKIWKVLSLLTLVGCGSSFATPAVFSPEVAVEYRAVENTRFKNSIADRSNDKADAITLCFVKKGDIVKVRGAPVEQVDKQHLQLVLLAPLDNCEMTSGFIFLKHFENASAAVPASKPGQIRNSENSQAQAYIENFRNEFVHTTYVLDGRGPKNYDCSTSIFYMFLKMNLLQDQQGRSLSIESFRNGAYKPGWMDEDIVNFRVLDSKEGLHPGDLILMGGNCSKPSHWVVISDIDLPNNGQLQENWRINRLMEVKGDPTGHGKYFDETWHHSKFLDNNLCAAVRYKKW